MSGFDPRPLLGLTTYLQQAQSGIWDVHATFLPAIYMEGVNLAGGTAVLLPPQPIDAPDRVLDGLDGLIITGGRDMDPAAYGQQRHPETDEPVQANQDRDAWEIALVRGAIRRGMPVLGICRGAQVINVALGGTLHQHLPDVIGHTRHQLGNAVFSTSSVHTVPNSRLAGLIGESSDAQCYHHQAIDLLGEGLVICAQDSDGVIEAVEIPGENFVLAVQWHPEERLDDIRLFIAVVHAAADYATGKVSA
ncbi:gamma-glutamyl-gamma-aminobutyrate hydrolase family protein [Mycolicibacterium stellerae]|uniref:gamma-glutamyl-gamma-aminobutyrate hydrolase family protein n=1 Tax=Mycolicibacterium stellerae TaxID=2358193 RepID=UPI000F0BB34B|nr:gamma-glutamyl-gamma-aminobutyrate hydrolase family protein [Mycolicibacterium stellerae]